MAYFVIKILWAVGLIGAVYLIVTALKKKPNKPDKKDDWDEF